MVFDDFIAKTTKIFKKYKLKYKFLQEEDLFAFLDVVLLIC